MTELKREYVVPLRRKTKLAPKWRRSKKAVSVLNEFIKKHMKTDNVVICKELNEKIWGNGIKNPPGKVSVIALKTNINGIEKTIVNLQEIGIDKQLEVYKSQMPATPAKEEKVEEAKPKKEEVKKEAKDAEVKEVKTKAKKEAKKDE
ncbi:MAG: 60S ribosomal protein L31 [Nanoarchaeota archaeon]|nr:60S ribosomal protein L31 [Nanoarchaeota archaeon]